MTDYKEYFKKYGAYAYNPGTQWLALNRGAVPTEEERYQAFKARLIDETRVSTGYEEDGDGYYSTRYAQLEDK